MKLARKTTAEKMKSVKASCGAAPFDEKRTKAWRYCNPAETAYEAAIRRTAEHKCGVNVCYPRNGSL